MEDELQRRMKSSLEAREFLENVLESSTEYSIIAKDLDRRILAWNSGAARNYGYEASEVIGRSSDMLHVPEESAQVWLPSSTNVPSRRVMPLGSFVGAAKTGRSFSRG